jgi:hypothetical protein
MAKPSLVELPSGERIQFPRGPVGAAHMNPGFPCPDSIFTRALEDYGFNSDAA